MQKFTLVAIALGIAGCGPTFTAEQRVAQRQADEACRALCDESYANRVSQCYKHDSAELQQRCREVAVQVRDRCYDACPD